MRNVRCAVQGAEFVLPRVKGLNLAIEKGRNRRVVAVVAGVMHRGVTKPVDTASRGEASKASDAIGLSENGGEMKRQAAVLVPRNISIDCNARQA